MTQRIYLFIFMLVASRLHGAQSTPGERVIAEQGPDEAFSWSMIECSICQNALAAGNPTSQQSVYLCNGRQCGVELLARFDRPKSGWHYLHAACACVWFKNHNTCPLCMVEHHVSVKTRYIITVSTRADTLLHRAAMRGVVQEVVQLIEAGQCVDARNVLDNTPLHEAVIRNYEGVAVSLLYGHASVDARNGIGETTLHIATWLGFLKIIDLLLVFGADVNAQAATTGNTPLHFATMRDNLPVVQKLLDSGADAMLSNYKNETPLALAVSDGVRKKLHRAMYPPRTLWSCILRRST